MKAPELRRAFTDYFVQRGHKAYPSMPLVPLHPKAPMLANAGMNQFLPVILGEEPPPDPPRATSIQKCVRLSGKDNDIDELGRTRRHLTFFEMLGNFSLGDYFKETAIPLAWELVTDVAGFDAGRLWVTVHTTDDEAEAIWHEIVGVPMERIQRLDKDNFWEMGYTGPCGPSSEIFLDCGPEWGAEGGPAHGGEDRYVEFWNLVFMQYERQVDGSLEDLPMKIIDTGGGLERWLMLLQNVPTVFDTDLVRPLISAAERLTDKRYGADAETDTALKVIGDHARSMVFLTNDGVTPSNEERGYILRSVVRRAVRRGYQLGTERAIVPDLVAATVEVLGDAYPELRKNQDWITTVLAREEDRFRETLATGSRILDDALESGQGAVSGAVAFQLHDTFGFPIELTREIAAERGVEVDTEGFDAAMEEQRRRARENRKSVAGDDAAAGRFRQLLEEFGPTEFTGYVEDESKARVLSVAAAGDDGRVEVFLDRTPFYAEGGGQVGDTGTITTATGTVRVVDTNAPVAGLHRHVAEVVEGEVLAGQDATATIDVARRDDIRRNHTGTHLLHWALREVLGRHVQQKGSLVAPDYLRFDFSHHAAVSPEELDRVQQMVNAEVLANRPVRAYETSKAHADELGAISFFDEKYGDYVRVVEAGDRSLELCGGTHVGALGSIGTIQIASEGSIGSNMRRIFALTGTGTLARVREREQLLRDAADLLKAQPEELPAAVERLQHAQRALADEVKSLRSQAARGRAGELTARAVNGVVVERVDGLPPDQLRDLALGIRDQSGVRGVVLMGSPDGEKVSVVAAVAPDSGLPDAPALVGLATGRERGGKDAALAQGGGRDVADIDAGLDRVRNALPPAT
jgi:alanyl-tRNA synthetase